MMPTVASAPPAVAAASSGHGATQLSATVSGATPARGRSTWIAVGVFAVVVSSIGVGVGLKSLGDSDAKPAPEGRTPATPTAAPEPSQKSAEPKVEPAVAPTTDPVASAEPSPSAEPASTGKKPVGKPPVSKPAGKPAETVAKPAEKPAEKPKPPEKDPLDQLKTF